MAFCVQEPEKRECNMAKVPANGDFMVIHEQYRPLTEEYEKELLAEEIAQEKAENMAGKIRVPVPEGEKEQKKWTVNRTELDKIDWDWLVDRANEDGIRIEQWLSGLVKNARINWVSDIEKISSPEGYVHRAKQKSAIIAEAHENAYAIAVNYKNYPTDDNAHLLHQSCERLGLDPQELIERVNEDRFADFVVKYRGDKDSKMNRCIHWVMDFCRDRDEISSEDFNLAGEGAGYTKQMLATARRRVGIESVLRGGKYHLSMPISKKVLFGKVRG